jgi:hypothetical protein
MDFYEQLDTNSDEIYYADKRRNAIADLAVSIIKCKLARMSASEIREAVEKIIVDHKI